MLRCSYRFWEDTPRPRVRHVTGRSAQAYPSCRSLSASAAPRSLSLSVRDVTFAMQIHTRVPGHQMQLGPEITVACVVTT